MNNGNLLVLFIEVEILFFSTNEIETDTKQ